MEGREEEEEGGFFRWKLDMVLLWGGGQERKMRRGFDASKPRAVRQAKRKAEGGAGRLQAKRSGKRVVLFG